MVSIPHGSRKPTSSGTNTMPLAQNPRLEPTHPAGAHQDTITGEATQKPKFKRPKTTLQMEDMVDKVANEVVDKISKKLFLNEKRTDIPRPLHTRPSMPTLNEGHTTHWAINPKLNEQARPPPNPVLASSADSGDILKPASLRETVRTFPGKQPSLPSVSPLPKLSKQHNKHGIKHSSRTAKKLYSERPSLEDLHQLFKFRGQGRFFKKVGIPGGLGE